MKEELPNFQYLGSIPNDVYWGFKDKVRKLIEEYDGDGDILLDSYPKIIENIRLCGFEHFYNAKIIVLPSGKVLDWQSYTGGLCQVQIVLDGSIDGSCFWSIRKNGKIEEKLLYSGEMWFTNTGDEYRLENKDTTIDKKRTSPRLRMCVTIECHFDIIREKFERFG